MVGDCRGSFGSGNAVGGEEGEKMPLFIFQVTNDDENDFANEAKAVECGMVLRIAYQFKYVCRFVQERLKIVWYKKKKRSKPLLTMSSEKGRRSRVGTRRL